MKIDTILKYLIILYLSVSLPLNSCEWSKKGYIKKMKKIQCNIIQYLKVRICNSNKKENTIDKIIYIKKIKYNDENQSVGFLQKLNEILSIMSNKMNTFFSSVFEKIKENFFRDNKKLLFNFFLSFFFSIFMYCFIRFLITKDTVCEKDARIIIKQITENMKNKNNHFQEEECIICLDKLENLKLTVLYKNVNDKNENQSDQFIAQLECKHSFHSCCISKWLVKQNKCPICRKPIYEKYNNLEAYHQYLQAFFNDEYYD